ncbi:MAG: hypothetical protein H6740_27670 [Alphaproteobacteria bacterium]|nr:hypothetical protein [Alphaproteobacteria bacterium]
MSQNFPDPWARAFEAFREDEQATQALALGMPARGRGCTIAYEPPELGGRAIALRGSRVRPVLLPLTLRRGAQESPLRLRIGWWPVSEGGALWVAGRALPVPKAPEALVAGLAERLPKGALAELLRRNLERQRPDALQLEELGLGTEGLLDGVSQALLTRLEALQEA